MTLLAKLYKTSILFVFIFISFNSFSSETDQFMLWNTSIKDSATAFNKLINIKLNKTIKNFNKKNKKYSLKKCRKLSLNFLESLREGPSLKRITKLDYQKKNPYKYPVDIFPGKKVSSEEYYLGSIHNKQKVTKMKELGRSFNVGGVNIGNDKMTHFVVVGTSYYLKYVSKRREGASHERALKYVMWRGFQKEASILGLKWGTFSFADLEANYQGFKLGYNLCEGPNSYTKFENKKFIVKKPIDIREYFTPGFDESYNRNYFHPRKLKKVMFAIDKNNYCPLYSSRKIKNHFSFYKNKTKDLTSQKYATKLLNIAIRAEGAYPNLAVAKSYFPLTIESQNITRICNDSIDHTAIPARLNYQTPDTKIEACATKQAGFKIRGRILSKTRRDLNAAITNFIQYAENYCFKKGRPDFKMASEFKWLEHSMVSRSVPFDPFYIEKCLVANIRCK